MEHKVSKELDYTPLLVAEPEYEYTRLYPQSGTTSTTVYSGGNDTVFEIPPSKAFNLSRSHFRFNFTIPGIADKSQMVFADFCPFFRQVQVYTRGGLYLMDHTNFHLHSKMVTARNKPLVETENTFNTFVQGEEQSMIPCLSSKLPRSYDPGFVFNPNSGEEAIVPYVETKYFAAGDAANAQLLLNVTIPFSEMYEWILCVDKDIMLNETLLIRFVWSELSNIAFSANPPPAKPANSPSTLMISSPDPTQGAAAIPAPANGTFNITDMAIYLAVEKNLAIVNELQSRIVSPDGFSLMIPYCYNNITSLIGNTSLMQYDYYPGQYDDYLALRWILKDSSILNPRVSRRNWCWIEEFGDGTSNFNKDNMITGIDLNLGEQKWDFNAFLSEATNLTHNTTIVCKRKLVITPNGLALV
ncbi:hypothetical protein SAMD00019534_062750 [Acytostelium subglobosum LB1]|uniref:hypothetical protein n=1 Tax=Acytostelium subglobosum LB1 TaxID=1410327 RepID=UPI000644ED78|nr:hypothetical protein SAMD00019534_062750 [Acytostelium subglobosum LB1]GAM23100.1 hypothetical protein SAMD00019534_062750 [Acytostelium subglobosum LB1]|eukprot:XP_012754327.1 hypothetical protein SAMD00019534_062750 [Acytostelium subglobosum LB1]